MDRSLISRRAFLGASAAGAAFAAVGARRARAEARPGYGGRIVASLSSAPLTFDPLAAWTYADVTLIGLVFDTLYRVDARGRIAPQLAATLPEAASATSVRIRLRRGVRCHDGHELSVADAVAALTRAARSPLADWALADVDGIAADGNAIKLELRRAVAPLDLALALSAPQLSIVRTGKKAASGSGPFKLATQAAHRVELSAHEDCFAGRPYVDQLTLRWFDRPDDEARAYEVGDADVSLRGAVAFAGHQPKYATDVVDGTATWLAFLGFGRSNAAVTDVPGFRAALSQAIGRSAFKHIGSGERVVPALVPESPDLGGAVPDAAAQTARPDAAALRPAASLRLSLITDRTRLDDADVAARIVTGLDAAGVSASYEALEPGEYARRVATGKCDLWLGQLLAPTTDPLHEILLAFAAGGSRWAVGERRAGKLDRARALTEWSKRWPVVPLYHRAVRAHHRETLHGVGFDALGRVTFADAFTFGGGGAGGGR